MSNYTIGLSGLRANNNALDVISNNIANSSTVGYKAGEYIFEDQFYKAINPLDPARAGQGTAKQNIRRLFNMGSVQESANTLDMAITGANGMFRLASNVDPDEVYYTRNGQFAVSKEVDPNFPKRSYIVNENGMYLTGYASQDGATLDDQWTSRLSMPPTSLEPKTTNLSTIAVNLDARTNTYLPSGKVPFNPDVPSSFNNKVSQTVYSADDNGGAHTLTLYYRRVDDKNLTITYDGASFRYPVSEMARNSLGSDPENVVLTSDTTKSLKLVSSSDRATAAIVDKTGGGAVTSDKISVLSAADIQQYARVMVDGIEANTAVSAAAGSVAINGGLSTTATTTANVRQAQIDKVALGGTVDAGKTIKLTINGKDVEYTTTASDVSGGVSVLATNLAAAYNRSSLPEHNYVQATTRGDVVIFTSQIPGDSFTLSPVSVTAGSLITASKNSVFTDNASVNQRTVTLAAAAAGVYVTGNEVNITLGGTTYTHGVGVADTEATIAASLAAKINAANSGAIASSSGGVLTVDAAVSSALSYTLAQGSAASVGTGTTATLATVANSTKPVAQVTQTTISGNYAVGDVVTVNVNGVDLNYTVTSTDIQEEGSTTADFERIAASIVSAFNLSTSPSHTSVTASRDGAKVVFTADVPGNQFSAASSVSGAGAIALDTAITLQQGQKLEFFNPVTTMPSASSSPVGSATVNITANSKIEKDQFVYKLDNGKVTRVVDSLGNAITVSGVSGTTLTLSGTPSVPLANDTLIFYNPVAYRLTLQDGSNVSMGGDLFRGQQNQKFTATTTKYEVYGSLDGTFYNSGNNLYSGNVGFPAPPVGDGAYKPIAEMQFWGGKNIDAVVTNPVTGIPTFESQVTLSGKVTTPGNTPTSMDPDLVFTLDLTGTRNFATPFGVDQSTQDGRSVALLNAVSIDDEGKIVGTYGDGRNFIAGQLVLVNFAATNGLVPSGGNVFQSSYLSGDEVHPNVIVGKPGQKGLGGIRAGAVEGSNVDLANELVKLLIQQRMYSANSQSIRAFDDTLTTTIRMTGG
ncbi:MAG: flagellar hook-basal body complex protein [Burkholderiaceae bacterium]|nr:flagellar hook-basal body complex protein [Burkholderiaceae bacterium]